MLWGTGGGADASSDTGGSSGNQTSAGNFRVRLSGRLITPDYAGTSFGFPGLWQVNFTLPSDVALDCFASVQVLAGGDTGNWVVLPIAAPGAGSCSNPEVNQSVLAKLDGNIGFVFGAFAIARLGSTINGPASDTVSGAVFSFTADQWIRGNTGPKFDKCVVADRTYPVGGPDPATPPKFLDAGGRLPFSGPGVAAGANLTAIATAIGPSYGYSPGANTWQGGGIYTLSGAGGNQVSPFSVSATFPMAFNPTNYDPIQTIDRTQPLTFTWTSTGSPTVYIQVTSNTRANSTQR